MLSPVIEGRGMFAAEQAADSVPIRADETEESLEMLRSYSFNPDEG